MTLLFALFSLLAASTIEDGKKGSEYGYALKSLTELGPKELRALMEELKHDDKHHLFEAALKLYPVPKVDASVGDDEPVAPEDSDSFEDSISVVSLNDDEGTLGRRELAGLPDKHGWANTQTRHCANEGGWCACEGNVVYTKKCAGTFSCNQANWRTVVSNRYNSNHKANVKDGVRCSNGYFGGDPWPGHDKQCFCHPTQKNVPKFTMVQYGGCWDGSWKNLGQASNLEDAKSLMLKDNECSKDGSLLFYSQYSYDYWWGVRCAGPDKYDGCIDALDNDNNPNWQTYELSLGFPDRYEYVKKWTKQACHETCGNPARSNWWNDDFWKGAWCGFSCTGACPVKAVAFATGRDHTFPIEDCAEHCYCVAKGWTG